MATSKFSQLTLLCVAFTGTLLAGYAVADEVAKKDHIMISGKDIVWKDAPASLPAGTKIAVLEGELSKEGPFTARFKVPAGFKLGPHFHPAIEHVTVIEGTFSMGLGKTWDDKALHEMGPGSFMVMDVGTVHFAMSKKGAVIQLHGVGPWGITYVNPADDPAKQAKK